jgi:hypothetical protein
MKLQEIISKLKEGTPLSDLIKITPYIPLLAKRAIMNNAASLSTYIDEETNMMKKDILLSELFCTLFVTIETSDVEIENLQDENGEINVETAIEAYESLMESGAYSRISCKLVNNDVDALVDAEMNQRIDNHNSVASVLNRAIGVLIEKIPNEDSIKELITQLPAQLASLGDLSVLTGGKKGKKKV